MARGRRGGYRLGPQELRQVLTSWMGAVPEGIDDRQARLLFEHLQWLDGRMPSQIYAEARRDFRRAPIGRFKPTCRWAAQANRSSFGKKK